MSTEKTPGIDSAAIAADICSIKALIDAANRAIWQDGMVADDKNLATDATFLLDVASEKALTVLGKI